MGESRSGAWCQPGHTSAEPQPLLPVPPREVDDQRADLLRLSLRLLARQQSGPRGFRSLQLTVAWSINCGSIYSKSTAGIPLQVETSTDLRPSPSGNPLRTPMKGHLQPLQRLQPYSAEYCRYAGGTGSVRTGSTYSRSPNCSLAPLGIADSDRDDVRLRRHHRQTCLKGKRCAALSDEECETRDCHYRHHERCHSARRYRAEEGDPEAHPCKQRQ